MAGAKIQVLVVIAVLLAGPAAGARFQLNVDDTLIASHFSLEHDSEVRKIQNVNLTVENKGSVGCTFRLRTVFQKGGGERIERYSQRVPLWSGGARTVELKYLPRNYTGMVRADAYLDYCGKREKIGNFTFNVTERTVLDNRLDSTTVWSNSSNAKIRLDVNQGTLIPYRVPAYWKTSSEKFNEGEAVIEYSAPIYTEDENITYAVMAENGSIMGKTKVVLRTSPGLWERLMDYRLPALYALVVLLAGLNLYQARDTLLQKIKALKK
ncbi:MAG: hypothetical protein ABEK01_00125 [Candidatus Nanohaloarchaea archaeon]